MTRVGAAFDAEEPYKPTKTASITLLYDETLID
jgi:hypothetical protein